MITWNVRTLENMGQLDNVQGQRFMQKHEWIRHMARHMMMTHFFFNGKD